MRLHNWIIDKKNKHLLHQRKIAYGDDLQINGLIRCSNPINLEFGNQVKINSGFINPVGNEVTCSFSTVGSAKIVIADGVGISNSTFFARAEITVGRHSLIGGGCRIYDTDFHPVDAIARQENRMEEIISKPIEIGENVFIGAHSIILKGVVIGNGSVIGAGSVVTKSVPEGEVWAGNPAKFIRKI